MLPKIHIWSTGTFLLDWMISFDFFKDVLDSERKGHRYEGKSRTTIHAHGVVKLKNNPGILRLVATTYSGRLAKEQTEDNSVLNRYYSEQLKGFSLRGKLADQCYNIR